MKKVVIVLVVLAAAIASAVTIPQMIRKNQKLGLFASKCLTKDTQLTAKNARMIYFKRKDVFAISGNDPCKIISKPNAKVFKWTYNTSPDTLAILKLEFDSEAEEYLAVKKIDVNIYKGGKIEVPVELDQGYYCFYNDLGNSFQGVSKIWDFVVLDEDEFNSYKESCKKCEKFVKYAMNEKYDEMFKLCTDEFKKKSENSAYNEDIKCFKEDFIAAIINRSKIRIDEKNWEELKNLDYKLTIAKELICSRYVLKDKKKVPYKATIIKNEHKNYAESYMEIIGGKINYPCR